MGFRMPALWTAQRPVRERGDLRSLDLNGRGCVGRDLQDFNVLEELEVSP
jgi:hypothetical protein